jgi:hypothetical protein
MAFGPFKVKVGVLEVIDIRSVTEALAFVEGLSPIFRDRLHWRSTQRMLENEKSNDGDEIAGNAFGDALVIEKWLVK